MPLPGTETRQEVAVSGQGIVPALKRLRSHAAVAAATLGLLAGVVAPARAQAGDDARGMVSGVVTDQTGGVLYNSEVELIGLESGSTRSTRSDVEGRYAFGGLPAGRYRVIAIYPGLEAASSSDLVVGESALTVPLSLGVGRSEAVVMVTASTRAQEVRDVQASAQVVTADDLRAFAGNNVTEALKLATGVDARSSGANASVSIRGFTASAGASVLLLVDGLRRTGKYGSTNLNLLELEGVERIEVIRGPMSALYGADATGGVINMVTAPIPPGTKPTGALRLVTGSMQDGQRGTFIGGGNLRFATGGVGHRLSIEQRNRNLFRFDPAAITADLNRIQETFVGYQGNAALPRFQALRWNLEFVNQDDTGPGLLAAAPPARPVAQPFDAHEREKRTFGAVNYSAPLKGGAVQLDGAWGKSNGSTSRAFPSIETTNYHQSQLQGRYYFAVGPHALVTSAGLIRDVIDVSNFLSRQATRTNTDVMVQDEWRLHRRLSALVGVRADHFTDFGSVVTPRGSLLFKAGPWSLRTGYGQAYRAPSVIEQYSSFLRGRFLILGDPSLRPERNKTTEAGVGFTNGRLQAEAVVFNSNVTDMIQSVTGPRQPQDAPTVQLRSQYSNVARARLRGVETTATWQAASWWALTGAWEYLDAIDASANVRLTQRARQNLRGAMRLAVGRWRGDLRVRKYIDFYAADPNSRTGPAFDTDYATADMKVEFQVWPQFAVSAGVDNLLDRRQPVNFSSTGAVLEPPARYGYIGIRLGF